MAEVNIEIAGRTYRVGCGDGEEQHLLNIARKIDVEARNLVRDMGQIGEARLLLMSCLMLADRLYDSESRVVAMTDELEAAVKRGEASGGSNDLFDSEREAELTAEVTRLATRLEDLAQTISPNYPRRGDHWVFKFTWRPLRFPVGGRYPSRERTVPGGLSFIAGAGSAAGRGLLYLAPTWLSRLARI